MDKMKHSTVLYESEDFLVVLTPLKESHGNIFHETRSRRLSRRNASGWSKGRIRKENYLYSCSPARFASHMLFYLSGRTSYFV